MKNILKEKFYKNIYFNKLGRLFINNTNYPIKSYYKLCKERANFEIWDYEEISKDIKMFLEDTSPDGTLYGILHSIKKYSKIQKKVNMYVEHGLYFGNLVRENSIDSIYNGTITFSNHRKNIISQKTNKRIVTIGPYIHYAEDYYKKEKFNNIKSKFGRTLLFFPPHSIKDQNSNYSITNVCKRLNQFKSEYKTIMVCLYYKDVNNGLGKLFEDEGFTVVSAGHFYDYNFLSRLKSIIKLADHTISMAIGTHIGYCIYLGKPHEIINIDRESTVLGESNRLFNNIKEKGIEDRGEDYLKVFKEDEDALLENFYNKGNAVNIKQQEICNKYWGFEDVKDPHIIRELLLGEMT
ncbi:hypothetical protein KIS4809_2339 [Bacillus sp. ZZV12-4809]|nr:hypothetical protein KIS4809_2339 [Bacillus sp. ZZV12-4809]